jgi:RNA polymerase sigma-70 factor, ECF subfamily
MQNKAEIDAQETILISAAARGDLEAFNDLVLKYQHLVYNLAFAILGDQDTAEDATQEAFISAFQHLKGFRGGSFRAWLLRIVSNTCYSVLRVLRRHPTVALQPEDGDGNEMESPLWLADPHPSAQAEVERDEFSRALFEYLDALPAGYRAVIMLVDLNGIDYAEAARTLSIPIGTVKSRLARARLQMRNMLSREYSWPSDFQPLTEQMTLRVLC